MKEVVVGAVLLALPACSSLLQRWKFDSIVAGNLASSIVERPGEGL
jgi:hypothetical protein